MQTTASIGCGCVASQIFWVAVLPTKNAFGALYFEFFFKWYFEVYIFLQKIYM
jgi:hypothetical protein